MKIQILISKTSWANDYRQIILGNLKKVSKDIKIFESHKKLRKNYDINIIFSYFEKIPDKYLNFSKINLIPHESALPKGRGMSPLTWQILKNKKNIVFSLIEANSNIDNGNIYYTKKVVIPRHLLFDEIKKIQLKENLKLIEKLIRSYGKKLKIPKSFKQKGLSTFYKKRTSEDSEININYSIKKQFNLLRTVDNKNYPAFFKIKGEKYFLKITKS